MARKKVVSIRLGEEEAEYLYRTARRLGRTPSATAAMLVDEGLRRERFPQVEMRDTAAGRRAFIKGTRIAVSFIVRSVRNGELPEELAEDLRLSLADVRACLDYADTFPEEIELEIARADEFEADPRKVLPGIMIFEPDASPA